MLVLVLVPVRMRGGACCDRQVYMQPFGCLIWRMDEVFKALADASRRALLDSLHARNGQSLNELCAGLQLTRQAVAKHLAVLEQANLVAVLWRGREKLHFLNPVPIHEIAERWLGKYERNRLGLLAQLKQRLEAAEGGMEE